MLNLILKDILIQKKTLGFVGLYILILSIAFQSIGAGAFIGIIIAVTYQLVVTAGSHEDKAGADIIMNSLPEPQGNSYIKVLVRHRLWLISCPRVHGILPGYQPNTHIRQISPLPRKTWPWPLPALW